MILPSLRQALCQATLFAAVVVARSCNSTSIERWGLWEKSLKGPTDGNPFVDTDFSATFTNGNVTLTIPGFYDGDGTYRVRFMPPEVGSWSWQTKSNSASLNEASGSFRVKPPAEGNHGPVSVSADGYHFVHADGTPFRPVGTTAYAWALQSDEITNMTIESLKGSPFNKMRMLFTNNVKAEWTDPFVLTGPNPTDWDPERFNVSYWQRYERQIRALGDLGIEAEVILYHPYEKRGFASMARTDDERYLRYIAARFSAYRHIWWSMANEYDGIDAKNLDDWDHLSQFMKAADPYHHLLSIHQINTYYEARKPWITHASIQNGAAVTSDVAAQVHREFALKPVIFDEVRYEGNWTARWARMTGQQMVMRFWWATQAGTYVTHGETYVTPGSHVDYSFLGIGGKLYGESQARLAFLRKEVLDLAPAPGIEPIQPQWDGHIGGKNNEFYVRYLGETEPTEYEVTVPGGSSGPKITYAVDVLDTWDMTVTSAGNFNMQSKGNDLHWDPAKPTIALPGKKYIAIRYRKVAQWG